MSGRARWVLGAALLALQGTPAALGADAGAADTVPLEAFGRLPTIDAIALSPDGTKLALVLAVSGREMLDIVQLQDNAPLGRFDVGNTKVRDLQWAGDKHLLIRSASSDLPVDVDGPRQEMNLLQSWDLDSGKIRSLFTHVRTDRPMMNIVHGSPTIVRSGGETQLFIAGEYFLENHAELALMRADLGSHAETLVREGGAATQYWLVNEHGEVVAEQDYFDSQHRWAIRIIKDRRTVQTLAGTAPLDYPQIYGLDADGRAAIVGLYEDGDFHYRRLSLEDGTWLGGVPHADAISGLLFEPGGQRLIGTAYREDTVRYRFVDPDLQRRWDWVERVFYGERAEYQGMSADHSQFLVLVLGPKSGYAYFIADTNEHLTRRVGEVYRDVPRVAEVRRITYPAADGLPIPAYLTLPPGRPEKGLPLIVMPHGGPQARDNFGFDWWAQALAAQGYVVLQPNYRGSNLDSAWVQKGYGEWGRRMQTDLSDGKDYLAKSGLIDPQRVCIVGASYGGYAAMAAAALQPGTYRCAVAVAGISDPAQMLRTEKADAGGGDNEVSRYWNRFMGVTGYTDKRLEEISPLAHVASITEPIMLIHGKDDTTVPYEQSKRLAKALEELGKPFEFVTLQKEDHYLSRSDTRLQMLTESVAFLHKYNPP